MRVASGTVLFGIVEYGHSNELYYYRKILWKLTNMRWFSINIWHKCLFNIKNPIIDRYSFYLENLFVINRTIILFTWPTALSPWSRFLGQCLWHFWSWLHCLCLGGPNLYRSSFPNYRFQLQECLQDRYSLKRSIRFILLWTLAFHWEAVSDNYQIRLSSR